MVPHSSGVFAQLCAVRTCGMSQSQLLFPSKVSLSQKGKNVAGCVAAFTAWGSSTRAAVTVHPMHSMPWKLEQESNQPSSVLRESSHFSLRKNRVVSAVKLAHL